MNIYSLIIINASNEEVEVFVTPYSNLEEAIEAQQAAINLEKQEREDEELTIEEYDHENETAILDDDGGYVIFKIQENVVK